MRKLLYLITLLSFWAVASPLARELTLNGDFVQGGLVVGKTLPGTQIWLDDRPVRVGEEGQFVFGFGRDFNSKAVLKVRFRDGREILKPLKIEKRQYQVERIDGLPPSKVTPSDKFLARIRAENAEIAKIRSIDTNENWFASGWVLPVEGRISGVFGSQRVLNGIPKRPHYGLDIAAPTGTKVIASTDGLIRMAEADLYYTGGTIMIDHGFGLVSVYSHLSKLYVKAGQFVKQGEAIGEVGSTGRSSGPHLDWRLNWFKERLDPELLLKQSN
ncbi:M23 family metallopeptidase [Sneathiella glossodoripedis]|uniref:M23 family metallopeptidase n=1 Tax=Sneathiella glossodoripedis TaxID=418853 RepID=UPI0005610815|nr:M23 family metallopeptidase [Sneathiella glossodoripedis]